MNTSLSLSLPLSTQVLSVPLLHDSSRVDTPGRDAQILQLGMFAQEEEEEEKEEEEEASSLTFSWIDIF